MPPPFVSCVAQVACYWSSVVFREPICPRYQKTPPSRLRSILRDGSGSPRQHPFAQLAPTWLEHAEEEGSALVPLARELFASIGGGADWLVHGDFHHHNILKRGEHYLAIDPKPYLADREYDVPTFLWNPMPIRMTDQALTQQRIAAFVSAGLDEYRIRAWTVIRGSYLRTGSEFVAPLRALVE